MAEQIAVPDTSNLSSATVKDKRAPKTARHALSEKACDPQHDREMDFLAQRMYDSVVIKDVPIKSSRWIQVPKGYIVDLEIRPAKHYKARDNMRTQVNKRKRETTLPETSQRGWREEIQGFRPEEMVWNGAIGFKHCEPEPSNLTNDIHPLFDRSCFDDTPDAIYDQLIPGLQLATLFLTQPICMQFWVTLAMGKRRHDPEMSALDGRPAQRIDNHLELTEERAKTVIDLINKLGKDKLVHFRFNNRLQTVNNSKDPGYAYAVSAPICDYTGIDTEYHGINQSLVRSIIKIHSDYYIVAKKLSLLKFPETSQKLRFDFGFAVLMVHELAHSIEGIHFRGRPDQWALFQQSGYYREPYWLDWGESECGRAWEQTMFGGHLQPTNGRVDGSHGIAVADWPFGDSANDPSPKSHRWWTVSMEYIEWIFRKETWAQSFDLKDGHVFHIPRDGATSLCINSFTTMDPSEEWRVAKEEAAALVALSNAQPAKKKRVKALGDTEDKRLEATEVIKQAVVEDPHARLHTPVFRGTRRLSSVMLGPLPDDAAPTLSRREKLIPHTRAPLSASTLPRSKSHQPKSIKQQYTKPPKQQLLSASAIARSEGTSSRQPKFTKQPQTKTRKQRFIDANIKSVPNAQRTDARGATAHRSDARGTNDEVAKEWDSRPVGIVESYKKTRKGEVEQPRRGGEKRGALVDVGWSKGNSKGD